MHRRNFVNFFKSIQNDEMINLPPFLPFHKRTMSPVPPFSTRNSLLLGTRREGGIPGGIGWKKTASKSTAVSLLLRTGKRRSRVKGSTPLVIPNQRSVHRNHDDEGEEEEEEEEEGSARRRPSSLPKKFLRRLWQRRLARERQSGDNAGRKTAGRERGPGPPP